MALKDQVLAALEAVRSPDGTPLPKTGALSEVVARFRGAEDGDLPEAPGHNIEVDAQQTADGYVLEAAVPWSDLNLVPAGGMRLGLALNANDNDSPGNARQEVMMSSEPGRTLTDPSTWGTLILESASN